jgi:Na+/H+-dicarboxylate symporter
MNTNTVVLVQSGSPGGLAILGPNIPQYLPLKLFCQYFVDVVVVIVIVVVIVVVVIDTGSVGTRRTRGRTWSRGMHYTF